VLPRIQMKQEKSHMTEENKGLSRRTVVKGAAWSVPVIAAAVATPFAAASVNNAGASWVGGATQLLTLQALDTTGTVNASVLPSAPTVLEITNGAGELPNVTFTVDVVQETRPLVG